MSNHNSAISFEVDSKTLTTLRESEKRKAKLTPADIGAKRDDNFVAWNCPFDQCRTPKR